MVTRPSPAPSPTARSSDAKVLVVDDDPDVDDHISKPAPLERIVATLESAFGSRKPAPTQRALL